MPAPSAPTFGAALAEASRVAGLDARFMQVLDAPVGQEQVEGLAAGIRVEQSA